MIIFLFKNCASLQQFQWHSQILSSSFKYSYKRLEQLYKASVENHLITVILFRNYGHLKLYIILCISSVLIIFYIDRTICGKGTLKEQFED